ncbi:hypothetical protein [Methylocapsa palsarum]|uniref:Uncharacterized protein n=1 Tax=Methylocapsa palsarum TaxID=1612308 RepID=A0A1I3X3A1_9HYPH|nr:hypothetical protein [Methylocapsa palsarum]SFK14198.1 hypothetical protein SAMN05444581_102342 [Methylocapsa palsarum]
MTEQTTASETKTSRNGPRDLLSRLYREIGISAVAAALESSAREPKKTAPVAPAEFPAFLRDDRAA